VTVEPAGDAAVIAKLGDTIDLATTRRAWAVAALARERFGESALDVVAAYASVLVRVDLSRLDLALALACLRGVVDESDDHVILTPRRIRVGVRFGGEYGEDLDETASESGLATAAYLKQLCAAEYRVAFLGFIAGFPYLMGLPAQLGAPRLATPRDRVPAGSVAIAGTQCGIYPRLSPGGWRLLGQTRATVFDPLREPAALFAPGDEVRFAPVKKIADAMAELAW
jgi:KipI family sensor histidine kinase inhibitor